jgi:predicted lipid-binding transport protein (Tim44 family)
VPADILLYAIVAAGLVFWLRNILGTRESDETQRPNPLVSNSTDSKDSALDSGGLAPASGLGLNADDIKGDLDRTMSVSDAVAPALVDIARLDRSFNLARFLSGAQDAFVIVVEAFAEGDKETLKELLSAPVFSAFSSVIDKREKDKEKASVEIHAIRKSEIIEASLEGKTAFITVRFVADETNVLQDKKDKLLSGHPDRVTETIDIWTFSRDLKSKSPIWIVTATKDEDAQDHEQKTVPDGGDQ